MQPAGGGAPRPGGGDGLRGCLRQLDPASPPMLLVDADRPEPMRSGARELALVLTPEPGAEVGDGDGGAGGRSRLGGVWGPRALGEKWTGAGDPSALVPGPELSASHPLSHAAQGLRTGVGARGVPFFCKAVNPWCYPEMRGRLRPLSLPADPAHSPSPPAAPLTPNPPPPTTSLGTHSAPFPLGLPAPAGTSDPGGWELLPFPGEGDPCQARGRSARSCAPGAGGGGLAAAVRDAPASVLSVARREHPSSLPVLSILNAQNKQ